MQRWVSIRQVTPPRKAAFIALAANGFVLSTRKGGLPGAFIELSDQREDETNRVVDGGLYRLGHPNLENSRSDRSTRFTADQDDTAEVATQRMSHVERGGGVD